MTAVTDPLRASARPAETVIARLRPHGRALVLPTVVLVLDAGAAVFALGRLDLGWDGPQWIGADALRWAVLVVAALVVVVGFLVPVLRFLTRTLTVTSRRVVIRSGMLRHSREELLHSSGYRVSLRRGALQLLFRSADLVFEGGGDLRVVVRDVPQARLVQEALQDLVDDARPRFPWDAPPTPSRDV